MSVVVVISTFPNQDIAARVARQLVEERLAACVNLVPSVRSIYRWKGEICDDQEVMVVCKTSSATALTMRTRLVALHPAELPEVIQLDVTSGHSKYLSWVIDEVA
jgi:periplasmic divalent cation tolerance protein